MVGRHHAHLLGLLQHALNILRFAVEDDVNLARLFDLAEQRSEGEMEHVVSYV